MHKERERDRERRGVREFDERIPTGERDKPISSADQIEAAVGAAPLLAEGGEEWGGAFSALTHLYFTCSLN